jgi:hypothetical protein
MRAQGRRSSPTTPKSRSREGPRQEGDSRVSWDQQAIQDASKRHRAEER